MTLSERWLLALADPENPGHPLPPQKLAAGDVLPLCFHAEMHGILPIVFKKVDRYLRDEPEKLLAQPDLSSQILTAIQPLQKRLAEKAAIVLFLDAELRKILASIHSRGAVAIPLKGLDFAMRLYRPPSARSYGDVDLLVRAGDRDCVSEIMSRLGYVSNAGPMKYDVSGYSEQAWEHPAMAGATVEVHYDLVNSPTLRRGVSVKFEDLPLEQNPDGQLRATPAGLLIIAAVHGATGHGFDRLQHVCDVAQIVRHRAGPIDEPALRECISKTGAGFSVALALDLVARTFDEPAAAELLARLQPRWPQKLSRLLITPAMIARSQGTRRHGISWRRQTLRQMLKRRR
jgi:Uncharacterised nucleotidyltransferase